MAGIGYLFVVVGVLAGNVKGFCGKKTSASLIRPSDGMLLNAVRMLLCIAVGFVFVLADGNGLSALVIDSGALLISAASGLFTSVFVVSWLFAVRKGAYMLVDTVLMMSVILPMTLSLLLFDEPILPIQWLGFLVMILATYIMTSYNRTVKGHLSLPSAVLLIVTGAAGSFVDFTQKWFVRRYPDVGASVFNFYTYLTSALILAAAFFVYSRTIGHDTREDRAASFAGMKTLFPYIAVMAFCLFLNSFCITRAAETLDAVIVYPLTKGGSLIVSLIMAHFFFGEKITLRSLIGIGTAFIGLILINLLPRLM